MTHGVRTQVAPASWSPTDTARRRVEPSDVAYALARRPRQGWQSIAQQLGVNAEDLRRTVEGIEAAELSLAGRAPAAKAGAKAGAAPARRIPTVLKPGSGKARALLAIAAGARSIREAAEAAGITAETARTYTVELRHHGMLGHKPGGGVWVVTAAGRAEVAAHKRLETSHG